jgi:hypothetical protein
MMAFGAWAEQTTKTVRNSSGRSWSRPIESPMRWLRSIFSEAEIAGAEAYPPQPRDVWLPIIQVMAARDQERSGHGFYVAAKGGHNNESHNHNDIGEFVVFLNGLPLLVDAGVESYSRKTFSPQRYEIWTMQSAYHNLPTIDGLQQSPGEEFAARDVKYEANDKQARFTLDIAGAYPPEAGVTFWRRTIRLNRNQSVEIEDAYELDHQPSSLTLSLLTPSGVILERPGEIRLTQNELPAGRGSAAGVVYYDADKLMPSVKTIDITDTRMIHVWGNHLYRILLSAPNPLQHDTWKLNIREP